MKKVAVILPCLNEENAIGVVVKEFRDYLPDAAIYIFDNGSDDNTMQEARDAGAAVFSEPARGKGNVVRRMFADVEADVYVMADGDGTYDVSRAPELVQRLLDERLDMIIGSRLDSYHQSGSRSGHQLGNQMITRAVNLLFGVDFKDILSGYRVMSRRFVKTAPVLVGGFEVETMLTIHALETRASIVEVPCRYSSRVLGTESKLRTYRDGWRILQTILYFFKEVRPFLFFSLLALLFFVTGLVFGVPVILEYMETGLVPRFPTAFLATGLMVLAGISLTSGLILDSVALQRREQKRFAYLCHKAPGTDQSG